MVIYTSPPHWDPKLLTDAIQLRIINAGGEVNLNGTSVYPRTSGQVQKIGPRFWSSIAEFEPVNSVIALNKISPVTVIVPRNDEIVGATHRESIRDLSRNGILVIRNRGDHNFTGLTDREELIGKLQFILQEG